MHQHDAALQVPEELRTLAVTAYLSVDEIVEGRDRDLAIGDGLATKPAKEGMCEQAVAYGGVFVGTLARVAGGVDHLPLALHDMQGAFDDAPIVVGADPTCRKNPPAVAEIQPKAYLPALGAVEQPFQRLERNSRVRYSDQGQYRGR